MNRSISLINKAYQINLMILGQFSPHIFFRTCSISVAVVLVIIYYISQVL